MRDKRECGTRSRVDSACGEDKSNELGLCYYDIG